MSAAVIIVVVAVAIVVIAIVVLIIYIASRSSGPCKTPGAFKDITIDQCFICPAKMDRSDTQVSDPNACTGTCSTLYPNSSLDLGLNQCWRCPNGGVRTGHAVGDPSACSLPCEHFFPGKGSNDGLDGFCYTCPANTDWFSITKSCTGTCQAQFPDSFPNIDGNCYVCPDGRGPTVADINSATACLGSCAALFQNSFEAGISGQCWVCPQPTPVRLGNPITGHEACGDRQFFPDKIGPATYAGSMFSRSKFVGPQSYAATVIGKNVFPSDMVGLPYSVGLPSS